MPFSILAAIAKNYCIGKGNKLPWHIPQDFEYFKKITLGKTCLMGKKTFQSILGYLGKPLPGRENVVITRDPNFAAPPSVLVFNSLESAWENLKNKEVFVIGGAEIFNQTIDKIDNLYITWVDQEPDGDVFFPSINFGAWKEVWREDHEGFSFVRYIKNN